MKYLMKVKFPNEGGNKALKNPQFGEKMRSILKEIKAEAAYFTTIDGCRGGYFVVNIDQASEIPALAEPFFMWLGAEIDLLPVMTPEDLEKAGPAMQAAIEKWA